MRGDVDSFILAMLKLLLLMKVFRIIIGEFSASGGLFLIVKCA